MIPTRSDLEYARRTARWVDRPLLDALAAADVPSVDLGPVVLARLGDGPMDPYFVSDGHPSAEGYALIGAALTDEVRRLGVAPS